MKDTVSTMSIGWVVLAMVMPDEETKVELKQFSDYLRNENKIVE